MEPLFPALPEDLSALSEEELNEGLASRLVTVEQIEREDADTLGDRSAPDVLAELQSGVEQIEAIRAQTKANEDAAEEYAAKKAELAARAHPEGEASADTSEEEPEGSAEDAPDGDSTEEPPAKDATVAVETPNVDVDVDVETKQPEPVTASVIEKPAPRTLRRAPRATRERQPVESAPQGAQLIASAGIRGIAPGEVLNRDRLAAALLEVHRVTSARSGGVQERVIVASAHADYPEDRKLDDNPIGNTDKINSVISPDSLTASGGICAPLTPLYDLDVISVADRPVRAALAGFQATRGGISVPTPLSLADVEGGVGVVTADEDALGGTFATKECVVIDCDPYTDCEIEAIYACIQHGNFGARTWPERVAALGDLLAAQHAKIAEIELLDGLTAGSTAVTDEAKYGATSTLLQGILKASAAMRSRHRMRPETRLRAILPAWSIDLLVADMVHTPYDRFERTRDGLTALLSSIGGVSASFYLDTPTGGGQIFAAQSAGALLEFPTTVIWYLFPEATWLFLDGGELDLGIVRDSILNSTNDFQIFMETFEGICMVGHESLVITSTVCPNGSYPAGATAFAC